MITAFVQFTLPEPLAAGQAREVFLATAPKYRDLPGLLRKYYVLSGDGRTAGGIYLWRSRADAERLYTQDWRNQVAARYGAEPTVIFLETPVVVDNVTNETVTA